MSSPPCGRAGIACAAWPTKRSAGSFRNPKTAWPSCCCSPGAVCPGWAPGLRERFALRRKHNIRRSGSIRGLLERLHLHPAIFLGTCVTAAAVIVLLSVYTIGTTVRYDGINLGTVGSRRTVDQAVQQLETVTRQTLEDQDYAIDTALLSTQTHVVPRRDLESREEFAENLTDQIGDVTYGYTLYVDGEAVAATTYAGAIDQLLEQMKAGLYHREHRGLQLCGKRGDQGGLCGQLPDLQPGLYRREAQRHQGGGRGIHREARRRVVRHRRGQRHDQSAASDPEPRL